MLFPHLDDFEITQLLDDYIPKLKFEEFNKLTYTFINSASESHDLDEFYPDLNSMQNLPLINSEYYSQEDFEHVLSTDRLPTVFMYNINSLPHNLENFLHQTGIAHNPFSIDIMSFCETKISNDIENLYNLNGYVLLTNNRNHYGGGVCMYIRNHLSFSILDDLCKSCDTIETLFVDVFFLQKHILIGIIYRRPNGNIKSFIETYDDILRQISLSGKDCILLGDININLLNNSDINVKAYINLLASYGYFPCINKPTRVNKMSATIIDHIWINNHGIISNSGILLTDISDHFLPFIQCKTSSSSIRDVSFSYHDYNNINKNHLCQILKDKLDTISPEVPLENMYDKVSDIIINVVHEEIPLKNVKIKNKSISKPWVTPELIKHIKERHKLYKKYLKRPLSFGQQYRELRNRVNTMLINAKKQYYKTKFKETTGNSKKTWELINEVINKSKEKPKIEYINVNNIKVTDPQILCNNFNTYFANIGKNLANDIPRTNTTPLSYLCNSYPEFHPIDTTPQEVEVIIKSLKDSAPGHDDIHVKIIKQTATIIAPVISKLINNSFLTGTFPNKLKTAKIIPIHKGGKVDDLTNYRPISILPCLSKIYERAMYDRLINFLNSNNILSNNQFGFRKNLSPKLAITKLIDSVIQDLGKEKFIVSVFLDLKKAFDTLDHEILLSKLHHYGIKGKIKDWFRSYLSNRYQCTFINNKISEYALISTGVPQGSTLGPLLFLLYINDITNSSNKLQFTIFADDTNLTYSALDKNSLIRTINSELNYVSNWLLINKLSLNTEKTKYLIFAGKKIVGDTLIEMCGNKIARVNSLKYLGITIDDQLTWKDHIASICHKLSKSSGILHKIKHLLTNDILLIIYYSLCYPYLHYCNVVWGMATKSLINPLVIIQKRIIRTLSNVNNYEHSSHLFKNLKILKIPDIHKLECLKLIHDQLQNQNIIHLTTSTHGINTRNRHQLRPIFPHTELQRRFVTYCGCIYFNNLSESVRDIENKDTFKMRVKTSLLNDY